MQLLYACELPAFWLIHKEGEADSSAVSEVLLDGHVHALALGESNWHKPHVCECWTLSTEGWFCWAWYTLAKRQQSGQGCSLPCHSSQHFAEISTEKWEWKHFQSWLQEAWRAAQTCLEGTSLKVILRLLPRLLTQRQQQIMLLRLTRLVLQAPASPMEAAAAR